MVQAVIKLGAHEDRVVNVVKGQHGLKNKSEAVNLIISKYEDEILEREVRPEYLRRLERISKQPGKRFKTMKEFREYLEKL